jgi:hypothetical protein
MVLNSTPRKGGPAVAAVPVEDAEVAGALLGPEGVVRQNQLTGFVDVTQPRTSQAVRDLRTVDLVEGGPAGWAVVDKAWRARGGWVATGDLAAVLTLVRGSIQSSSRPCACMSCWAKRSRPAVCVKVAADFVVSLAHAGPRLLQAKEGADLAAVALTLVSAQDAMLILVLPQN